MCLKNGAIRNLPSRKPEKCDRRPILCHTKSSSLGNAKMPSSVRLPRVGTKGPDRSFLYHPCKALRPTPHIAQACHVGWAPTTLSVVCVLRMDTAQPSCVRKSYNYLSRCPMCGIAQHIILNDMPLTTRRTCDDPGAE